MWFLLTELKLASHHQVQQPIKLVMDMFCNKRQLDRYNMSDQFRTSCTVRILLCMFDDISGSKHFLAKLRSLFLICLGKELLYFGLVRVP